MHVMGDGRRVATLPELLGLSFNLDTTATGRCGWCAQEYPSDRPPPLVEVAHLPPVERIEGLPPHLKHLKPLIDARPEWQVRRIERRTVRSHQAAQIAGKRRGARGVYATSGDRRVLKLVDVGPGGRFKLDLRCPRCRRRPPIGVEGLIQQAERPLTAGRWDFLI